MSKNIFQEEFRRKFSKKFESRFRKVSENFVKENVQSLIKIFIIEKILKFRYEV